MSTSTRPFPWKAAVLLALLAASASSLWWFLTAHNEPLIAATDGESVSEQSAEPTARADSAALAVDSSVAVVRVPETLPNAPLTTREAPSRTAVGDAVDTRRWRDFIVAVDDSSALPIDGAQLFLIDAEGERRLVAWDELVLEADLQEGGLAFLVTPTHVPRAFVTHELRTHNGPPSAFLLRRTGALRCELVGEELEGAPPIDVRITLAPSTDGSPVIDTHLVSDDESTSLSVGQLHSLGALLRRLLDETTEATWRKRQLRWLWRRYASHPTFALDGPPMLSAWVAAEVLEVASWPLDVKGVPSGVDVLVWASITRSPTDDVPPKTLLVRRTDDEEWRDPTRRTLGVPVRAHDVSVVQLQFVQKASLRGLLPVGATAGEVLVMRARERNAIAMEQLVAVRSDGAFELTGLAAGHVDFSATWRDFEGAVTEFQLSLELAPGEERDLGRLAPREDSRTLTIVPLLIVDGKLDQSGLSAQLADAEYDLLVLPSANTAGEVIEHRHRPGHDLVGLNETVVRGLAPARHSVHLGTLRLPEHLAARYQVNEWQYGRVVDLTQSDVRLEVVVGLTPAAACELIFELPAAVKGSGFLIQAEAYSEPDGTHIAIAFDDPWIGDGGRRHSLKATAMLPLGKWNVIAVASPHWRDSGDSNLDARAGAVLQSFVGTAVLDVPSQGLAAKTVELELAAVARVTRLDKGSDIRVVHFQPRDSSFETSSLWWAALPPNSDELVVWGLLPHTQYLEVASGQLVTTGAGGSVVELEY